MRVRPGLAVAAMGGLAFILAACGGEAARSLPPAEVSGGVVEITADNLQFSATTIHAPSGEAFTIELTNLENVPHNLSVYTREGGDPIVIGEFVDSAGDITEVEVPPLEPGTYYFVCDVHPGMDGSLVVGAP